MARVNCLVVIVGAGLAGLAAAIALSRDGHSITVLERAPELTKTSAGINLPPNGSRAASYLKVLDAVRESSLQISNIIIRSYKSGQTLSNWKLSPSVTEKYGFPYYTAHRGAFHHALLAEALELGVNLKLGAQVARIDFPNTSVHLENGEVYQGDLILGADGENSQCRELLLGRKDPPYHWGEAIYAFDISQDEIRQHEELRDLIDPPKVNFWFAPGTHVVAFALKESGLMHVIGGLPEPGTSAIRARPYPIDPKEVRDYHKDWDSRLQSLLKMPKFVVKWTSTAMHELHTWQGSGGTFVLLGDSAHAMGPYLGQGAAQALEDAVTIARLLRQMSDKRQIPDAVSIYENLRKPRLQFMQRMSHDIKTMYALPDGPQQEERDRQLQSPGPSQHYPVPWLDPIFQDWMYSYDAEDEADRAWAKYLEGERPETTDSSKIDANGVGSPCIPKDQRIKVEKSYPNRVRKTAPSSYGP